MKERRTYKHTEKFMQKKAMKEKMKAIKLKKIKEEKIQKISDFSCSITPLTLFLEWLKVKYDISEFEFLFGSIDFIKQTRVEVARKYLDLQYESKNFPTPEGLEEFFTEYAIKEFCKK